MPEVYPPFWGDFGRAQMRFGFQIIHSKPLLQFGKIWLLDILRKNNIRRKKLKTDRDENPGNKAYGGKYFLFLLKNYAF
jgi:hypothetical protein